LIAECFSSNLDGVRDSSFDKLKNKLARDDLEQMKRQYLIDNKEKEDNLYRELASILLKPRGKK